MRPRHADTAQGRRRRANRLGQRAEWLAAAFLTLHGYRILALRYRVDGGEIDVIARRGATVAFVEVKVRASLEAALLAVTPGKRRRVERAASVWLSRNRWAMGCNFRGDVVIAAPWRWPRHIAAAFPLSVG